MQNSHHRWNIAIIDQRSGSPKLWRRALRNRHRLSFYDSYDELIDAVSLNPDHVDPDAPQLIIMDWDGVDGEASQFIQTLRHEHENGVAALAIFDEDNMEFGLEACRAGCNEFLTRPLDQLELAARIVHLLEYRPRNLSLPEHYPPFRFDPNRRSVAFNGTVYRPRAKEFDLMLYFFRRPDRIISRSTLLDNVWFSESGKCRSIDTYISRLRSMFGLNGDSGWAIKSVYREGYQLVCYDET